MATMISWTNETWNPTTGCSKVSEGCRNCYAERLSLRFGRSKKPWTAKNAAENVILHPDRLRKPYAWKEPKRVFVNSMSDLFHELIPDAFIEQVFAVMNDLPQHTFQVLTKRPERAATWPGPWTSNIWMGTSVEDQRAADLRIPALLECGAGVRFLSCEPLLDSVDLQDYLAERIHVTDGLNDAPDGAIVNGMERVGDTWNRISRLHWVIVGGESGAGFRPMDHAWARAIRDQCVAAGVAFFFKQSSAFQTERGTALVEEDESSWEWHQFPPAGAGAPLEAPVKIAP